MAWAPECLHYPLSLPGKQIPIDSHTVSFYRHISCGPHTCPHFLFVVLFPARLAYFPSSSLVFLDVSSTSLFSIWNLFYPLYRSIDLLSYRPPASWCPLFTVTQAIIAYGSLLIIPMLAADFPADAIEPSRILSRGPPGLLLWPDNSLGGLVRKTKSSHIF